MFITFFCVVWSCTVPNLSLAPVDCPCADPRVTNCHRLSHSDHYLAPRVAFLYTGTRTDGSNAIRGSTLGESHGWLDFVPICAGPVLLLPEPEIYDSGFRCRQRMASGTGARP